MDVYKKILKIFDRHQKIRFFEMIILIFLGTLVETIGVTAIVPFIEAIMYPNVIMANKYVAEICLILGINDSVNLVILLAIGLMLVYIFKNMYLCFMYNAQFRFVYNNQRRTANKLMQCYISQPYEYHLNHNTAELINNLSIDIDHFYQLILHCINFVTDVCVCAALMVVLFIADGTITIVVVLVMGIFVGSFYKHYKHRLLELGEIRRISNTKSFQCIQQAFGAIKEVKLLGREDYFVSENDRFYGGYTDSRRKVATYAAYPKPIMESISIVTILVVIVLKMVNGNAGESFIPTLSVFALAVIRILPSSSRISNSLNNIAYCKSSINVVYEDIMFMEKMKENSGSISTVEKLHFDDCISIENLSFKYVNGDINILDDLSLKIPKNQSVAFIGASGAGKTTLADIILGVLDYQRGNIYIDSTNMKDCKRAWQNIIGYIPQNIYILDDTIRHNVAFAYADEEICDERIWSVLEQAQLSDFVKSLPEGLDTVIGEMGARISGGQRQRIGIARALYNEPEVLVLDEATSALDGDTETAVMEAIEALNGSKTIIIIAHRLTTIENCSIVYRIEDGKAILQ